MSEAIRPHTGPMAHTSPVRLVCAFAAIALAGIFIPGCAFDAHRRELEALHAAGRYDAAARLLDDQRTQGVYGDNDRLLYFLDRGAVALALSDSGRTLVNLEEAERIMDQQHGPSASDTLISWTFNDAATTYLGEPYEDIYCNVLKLLAHLESGNLNSGTGGAAVEARRAASKADLLRARYREQARGVLNAAAPGLDAALQEGPFAARGERGVGRGGEFIESPLGTYLTAVTFMKTGDRESQRVAGRRLVSGIEAAGPLVGDVRADSFQSLGDLSPESANVLVVGFSGRGPTKVPMRIGPVPIFDWPVYFELPVLRFAPSEVAAVRITATPVDVPGETEFQTPLSLVECMASVAVENHRRQLPLIYARSIIRSSGKAGLSYAATQQFRRRGKDGWTAAASVLGGLAAVALTERADLRCWAFLPGQAHVGLLHLDPGQWRLRVEYLSASGGTLYTGSERSVRVSGGSAELQTIVEHFWR